MQYGLKRIFSKYTGFLRSLKLTYVLNNLLNIGSLRHGRQMAKQHGLRANVIGPVGTKDMPATDQLPWLDRPDALESMKEHTDWSTFSSDEQTQLVSFVEEGFMVLKGFYSSEKLTEHNLAIDELLDDHTIDFNYSGSKLMDVHQVSDLVNRHFFKNERLLRLLAFIFGKEVIPFQSIHFISGSQQRAHSDSIHMSTYPPGYLLAAWTALEDIGHDQGPVFYYPGTHRWPYVSCEDYESGNTKWMIGKKSYAKYENYIDELISTSGIKPKLFTAQAGDVLIWHANLLHGGSAIKKEGATRRSMVAHYYADDVFCYHEISQRVAHIDRQQ